MKSTASLLNSFLVFLSLTTGITIISSLEPNVRLYWKYMIVQKAEFLSSHTQLNFYKFSFKLSRFFRNLLM